MRIRIPGRSPRRDAGPFMVGFAAVLFIAIIAGLVTWVIVDEMTEPDSGTITGKTYRAAWWSTSCHKSGKITVCTPVHHPECYEIDYTNGGSDGDACVTAAEYDRLQVGQWYGKGAR